MRAEGVDRETYVVARVLVEIGALVQREHVVAAVGPVAVAAHERGRQQPASAQRAVHGGYFEHGVAAKPIGEARHERGLALVVALVRELALHHRCKLVHKQCCVQLNMEWLFKCTSINTSQKRVLYL